MKMKKITPPISEAKLMFLEQKTQALTIQNTFLEEENTKLQDELEVISFLIIIYKLFSSISHFPLPRIFLNFFIIGTQKNQ